MNKLSFSATTKRYIMIKMSPKNILIPRALKKDLIKTIFDLLVIPRSEIQPTKSDNPEKKIVVIQNQFICSLIRPKKVPKNTRTTKNNVLKPQLVKNFLFISVF